MLSKSGAKHQSSPGPPTCIGPFVHFNPSALESVMKKSEPGVRVAAHTISSREFDVILYGGCMDGVTVST